MRNEAARTVAVVGLGKLGLPLACVLAARGRRVHGVDTNAAVVQAINAGRYVDREPRVAELLAAHQERISAATHDAEIAATSLAFVVVPTPSDANDRFSARLVLEAVRSISARVAAARLEGYTIVLVSTVMPGCCQNEIEPAIREAAPGSRIDLVYSPEFVALGDVVRGMRKPDLVLIGARDKRAADRVECMLRLIVENRPRFVRTSHASAEVAKLGLNTLVSTKITCANLLARICQELPEANVDDVTRAIGADRRIGARYLRGGLGYGGPCFPRDVLAMASLCEELRIDAAIPLSISRFNDGLADALVDLVLEAAPSQGEVAVLGITYRPGTNITEGSHGLRIARHLIEQGVKVHVRDPALSALDALRLFGRRAEWHATVETALAASAKVVIASCCEEFGYLPPEALCNRTVIDCWRQLAPECVSRARRHSAGFCYLAWGHGPVDASEALSRQEHDDALAR